MADIDEALAHRAEQALLGALIAGANPAVVRDVHPADFRDPVHQAIYAAITGQFSPGGPAGRVRAGLDRAAGVRVAQAAEYAAGLPAHCPRRDHLLVYGAMVLEVQRPAPGTQPLEGGDPGRRLAGADAWLSSATSRGRGATQPGATGDGRGRLAPGTQRLARALAPIAKRLRDPVAAERLGSEAVAGVVLPHGKTGKVTAADLQDLVLAGLMRHPGQGRALAGRVPPEVFGGTRRELYMVVRQLLTRRLPVDALIVAWEARKKEAAGAGEPAAVLALRLGEWPVLPGTAGHLCRGLLADYELTTALGRDWIRQELSLGDRQRGPAVPDGPRAAGAPPGAARTVQAPAPRPAGPGVQQDIRRPQPSGPAAGIVPRHG